MTDLNVAFMIENPGVYVCGDSAVPDACVVIFSARGVLQSIVVDADLDPDRFLPTFIIKGAILD